MQNLGLAGKELEFAELVWANEPLGSGELAKLCFSNLGWKKSTAYTVLKKLSDKGYFKNENGTVTSVVSRKAYFNNLSNSFVSEYFEGSIAKFIAYYQNGIHMTRDEILVCFNEVKKYNE